MKYRLCISYDGTCYHGWQKQPGGIPTIQQSLEEAFATLTKEKVSVLCAGRTDAGVHAVEQVASVQFQHPFEISRLRLAINALLPADIVIRNIEEAPDNFQPRFQAKRKQYRYLIYNHKVRNLFHQNYCWHIPQPLDIKKMQNECVSLLGTHDFSAFKAQGCTRKCNVKTIYSASISYSGAWVVFDIIGDGFLKQMVRTIIGSLSLVGRGKENPGFLAQLIKEKKRNSKAITAPAKGLNLIQVFYDDKDEQTALDDASLFPLI